MGRTARCPSCAAPVEFKSVASILAVCSYCQSTLVREGQELANLGKMAALIEDRSPLQRGAEGRWKGRHFALIGRIQLRWEQGLWNEWHLLFDDGKSGWLSESGGEYVISEPVWQPAALPVFSELHVGESLAVAGRSYSITNLLTAECVAGEGELPFKVGAGYAAPVADLRDEAGGFATLDYSDDAAKPMVFVGASVEFGSLAWNNLRQGMPAEPTVKARAFNCPACAAPLSISHANIKSVGCPSCGAVLDTANETVQMLGRASMALKVEPALPLGTRGRLRGEDVEVIGFMRRRMTEEGVIYRWSEYVLLGRAGRLLWLTEYRGHWNLVRVLPRAVTVVGDRAIFEKSEFKHFQSYHAYVDYVVGEFPWRVQIDEAAAVEDYVAPPRMISRETTDGEETITLAEYIPREEVGQAFKITYMPMVKDIFANQINPYAESNTKVWHRFWMLLALALAVHVVLLIGARGPVLDQILEFSPGDDEPQMTREFRLATPVSRLEIRHEADLSNNWIALDLTLVNKDTGEAWQASREISNYEGVDDGESWSEGSRSDSVVFAALPAGTYVIAEDADLAATSKPVRAHVSVSRPGPRWSSLFLLLAALALFPVYTFIRRYSFEVKRWAESDHPLVTSSSGTSDSDSDD
jgi:ribosomal protein L37AE/L43A